MPKTDREVYLMDEDEDYENYWRDAETDPPENDRLVQIAWDDGSTSLKTLGFYDSKATIPQDEEKFWWEYPNIVPYSRGDVLAWREVDPSVDPKSLLK